MFDPTHSILTLFLVLKFVHVLSAIVAVGANATYGAWIARAARAPEHMAHTLQGIKFIDSFIANPAYGALLVTGLGMAYLAPFPLTTLWIALALVLYAFAALMGIFVFTPLLRRQLRVLETEGPTSAAFARLRARASLLGLLISADVLVIVALMVFKPTL